MATPEEQQAIREIAGSINNPCVVELGARLGEDEVWIRQSFTCEVHYVMVEPDIQNAQVIIENGIHRTRRLIIGACAASDGYAEFWGSVEGVNTRGSGSIRKPTKHILLFPAVEFPKSLHTQVPTYTLDTIFVKEWLSKIDLLWVDVQGAERDVIEGGQKALSHTRYLFIETEDRELYEGMATKPEILKLLDGWNLIRDFGYNCLLKNPKFTPAPPR